MTNKSTMRAAGHPKMKWEPNQDRHMHYASTQPAAFTTEGHLWWTSIVQAARLRQPSTFRNLKPTNCVLQVLSRRPAYSIQTKASLSSTHVHP